MKSRLFGDVALGMICVGLLLVGKLSGQTLDPQLRASSLNGIGFNKKVEVCIDHNSTYGWVYVINGFGLDGHIDKQQLTSYFVDLGLLSYTGGETHARPAFEPTQQFISVARTKDAFIGFGQKHYCLSIAKRVFKKVTYFNKWMAPMDLGEQQMIAFTFTYSMETLFDKPVTFGDFDGKIVMTLDPTDGKWKILKDRCSLEDRGLSTISQFLSELHPTTSILPPSTSESASTNKQTKRTIPFREHLEKYTNPGKFPIRERRFSASIDDLWKAANRVFEKSESYFNMLLTVAESDRDSGFMATKQTEKRLSRILLRVQVFIGLTLLSSGSTEMTIVVSAYDFDLYSPKEKWVPEPPAEVARMAEQFLDNVEKELKLAPFADFQISSEKTDFTGNWKGSLVETKTLRDQECRLTFNPVSENHTTGILNLGDLPCPIQLLDKERSGSMVTFVMFTNPKVHRKCRGFAKKHELDVFPTKDGYILIRMRKAGRDTITGKALLRISEPNGQSDFVSPPDKESTESTGEIDE